MFVSHLVLTRSTRTLTNKLGIHIKAGYAKAVPLNKKEIAEVEAAGWDFIPEMAKHKYKRMVQTGTKSQIKDEGNAFSSKTNLAEAVDH